MWIVGLSVMRSILTEIIAHTKRMIILTRYKTAAQRAVILRTCKPN